MSESCRFEANVMRAARFDEWTTALREHTGTCEDCAAAAAVAPWMGSFATLPDRERALPSPAILWLKAQILQREAAAERAAMPVTTLQIAAYLVVGACWAALLTWKWNAMREWMLSFTPAHFLSNATGASQTLSLSFMVVLVGLASVTLMLAMHTILADE